jgi:putative tricarboxylic transport membrane protein
MQLYKNLGIYISIFFLIVSGLIFFESLSLEYYSDYGPGPGLLPLWTSGIIIVLSLLYLVFSIKKDIIDISAVLPKGEGFTNILITMGTLILFIVVVPFTGFFLGSILLLIILFKRGYNWYWSIGLSLVVAVIIFYVFGYLLQVPLPTNKFGW